MPYTHDYNMYVYIWTFCIHSYQYFLVLAFTTLKFMVDLMACLFSSINCVTRKPPIVKQKYQESVNPE